MAHRFKLALLTSMLFVALSLTGESQAHAYVDAGSSLLIYQSLCAAVSGAIFYFRRRIRNLFTKTEQKPAPISAPINNPAPDPR